MKNIFIATIAIATLLSTNMWGQDPENMWFFKSHPTDELLEIEGYNTYEFWTNNYDYCFSYDDNGSEEIFVLLEEFQYFNKDADTKYENVYITNILVGYYDENNNLINKETIKGRCHGISNYVVIADSNVLDYIKNHNGYVRFVGDTSLGLFDQKIPTFKTSSI